jgi:stress-induced morphogen
MGDDGTGETHFLIEISSENIPKKFTHEKHKLIVEKLGDIFKKAHSIEIKLI